MTHWGVAFAAAVILLFGAAIAGAQSRYRDGSGREDAYVVGMAADFSSEDIVNAFFAETVEPMFPEGGARDFVAAFRGRSGDVSTLIDGWDATPQQKEAARDSMEWLEAAQDAHEAILTLEAVDMSPEAALPILLEGAQGTMAEAQFRNEVFAQVEKYKEQWPEKGAVLMAAQAMRNRLDDLKNAAGSRDDPRRSDRVWNWEIYLRRTAAAERLNKVQQGTDAYAFWSTYQINRKAVVNCAKPFPTARVGPTQTEHLKAYSDLYGPVGWSPGGATDLDTTVFLSDLAYQLRSYEGGRSCYFMIVRESRRSAIFRDDGCDGGFALSSFAADWSPDAQIGGAEIDWALRNYELLDPAFLDKEMSWPDLSLFMLGHGKALQVTASLSDYLYEIDPALLRRFRTSSRLAMYEIATTEVDGRSGEERVIGARKIEEILTMVEIPVKTADWSAVFAIGNDAKNSLSKMEILYDEPYLIEGLPRYIGSGPVRAIEFATLGCGSGEIVGGWVDGKNIEIEGIDLQNDRWVTRELRKFMHRLVIARRLAEDLEDDL